MKNLIARFVKDQSGATAIEYGLMQPAFRLRSLPPLTASAPNLNAKFTSINTSLK